MDVLNTLSFDLHTFVYPFFLLLQLKLSMIKK